MNLESLCDAEELKIHVSHSNRVVDTRHPLVGEPIEFENDELIVICDTYVVFLKEYRFSEDEYIATKARSRSTRPRDRATTYTIDKLEATWNL